MDHSLTTKALVAERFANATDYLKKEGHIKTYTELFEHLSISNRSEMNDLRHGRKIIPKRLISALCKVYPFLSYLYITEGIGNMVLTAEEQRDEANKPPDFSDKPLAREPHVEYKPEIEIASVGQLPMRYVPHLSEAAQAGYTSGYVSGWRASELPLVPVFDTPELRAAKEPILVDVVGDSMTPEIKPGDQLLCDLIPSSKWRKLPPDAYVIMMDDCITVKLIRSNTMTTGRQELISINKFHGPVTVDSASIQSVLRIIELRRRNPRMFF